VAKPGVGSIRAARGIEDVRMQSTERRAVRKKPVNWSTREALALSGQREKVERRPEISEHCLEGLTTISSQRKKREKRIAPETKFSGRTGYL